jgi:hypothetical protein
MVFARSPYCSSCSATPLESRLFGSESSIRQMVVRASRRRMLPASAGFDDQYQGAEKISRSPPLSTGSALRMLGIFWTMPTRRSMLVAGYVIRSIAMKSLSTFPLLAMFVRMAFLLFSVYMALLIPGCLTPMLSGCTKFSIRLACPISF